MAEEVVCLSRSPDETRALGEALAPCLGPGDVVALTGDLGAGKTRLVQGVARALGVRDPVTSPTFLLLKQYEGTHPIAHLDVFRMGTLQDLVDLGYDELLDSGSILLIEWGDAVQGLLPPDYLEVEMRAEAPRGTDAEGADTRPRRIALRARGPGWSARLGDVRDRTRAWHAPPEG